MLPPRTPLSQPKGRWFLSRDFLRSIGLNELMKIWLGFRRLSGFERGIALKAAAALTITWVGLRLTGFRRWKSIISRLALGTAPNSSACNDGLLHSARVISRLEESVARHLFIPSNCLERSLVLWWLLRVRGISADLRIGARKEADRFEAHAWVEFGSEVLSSGNDAHLHFVPFEGPLISMETQSN
jgi:hypothetical protein